VFNSNRTNSKLEELTFSLKDGLAQIQEKIMGTSNQIAELQMQNKQQEIELREVRNEKNNLQKKVSQIICQNSVVRSRNLLEQYMS